jgi:hypothetical protein
MSFPLVLPDRVVPDAPAMAALVRADAGVASGTVVPGKRPAEWVMDLVRAGSFDRRLAIGLAAALIQNPEVATVREGARLAQALGDPVLGPLVRRALDGHDTALLLQSDPGRPGASAEDTLLEAACPLCDLADPEVRRPLLERLRHAGLRSLEAAALLRFGDVEDLEAWLPAVLTEGLAEEHLVLLTAALAEDDARAHVVRRIVSVRG